MKDQNVTPWEVTGDIDYDRLIKEFGLEKISPKILEKFKKQGKTLHFMLRRGIFFAGRDLKWLFEELEKGNKFFLYTGCGPSGPIHLGHLQVWLFTKWLQDVFDCELYFQFTDDEKFLIKDKDWDEIDRWTYENMLDIIALGFDPKKTHFLVDTNDASLMYREATKVAKKITFNMVKSSFGLNESSNIGQVFITSMQAVPAFLPSVLKGENIPCLIPHAVDQDPHFRLTRDILPKLGYYKPASIQCSFLPPMSGNSGKMSSTGNHSIFTTDTPKEVKTKINKYAFSGGQPTIEEHKKLGGNPDIDVSYQYLRMLLMEDDDELKKIHDDYKSGALLTSELKKITIDKINQFLASHQEKRAKASKLIDDYLFKI